MNRTQVHFSVLALVASLAGYGQQRELVTHAGSLRMSPEQILFLDGAQVDGEARSLRLEGELLEGLRLYSGYRAELRGSLTRHPSGALSLEVEQVLTPGPVAALVVKVRVDRGRLLVKPEGGGREALAWGPGVTVVGVMEADFPAARYHLRARKLTREGGEVQYHVSGVLVESVPGARLGTSSLRAGFSFGKSLQGGVRFLATGVERGIYREAIRVRNRTSSGWVLPGDVASHAPRKTGPLLEALSVVGAE